MIEVIDKLTGINMVTDEKASKFTKVNTDSKLSLVLASIDWVIDKSIKVMG